MRFKKLAVITDCIHFETGQGNTGTYNHVLMRQLQALTSYFENVLICCPFIVKPAQDGFSEYSDKRIKFLQSEKVGGDSISAKWKIIKTIPSWLRLYKKVNAFADIVYMRFPNNISIPAFFYFLLKRKRTFATFTAPWDDDAYLSGSTNFQRWLLKNFFKGPVWIYTQKEELPYGFYQSFSPSYSAEVWQQQQEHVKQKASNIAANGIDKLKIVAAGSLDERKNHIYILKACVLLKEKNIPFTLTIAGSGELKEYLQAFITQHQLDKEIFLAGFRNDEQLKDLYQQNDFVIQSSISEGYGKVPAEGFFFGLIPLISSTSLMADEFTKNEKGFVFDIEKPDDLFQLLEKIYYKISKEAIAEMMIKCNQYARNLTIDNWAHDYATQLDKYYA